MGITDIQIEDVGGRFFTPTLSSLHGLQGFDNLVSIGITRDADNSFENMFQSVQGSLGTAGFSIPSRPMEIASGPPDISVYIFPDNNTHGALENLCISSLGNDPSLECVENYFSCLDSIDQAYGTNHPHPYKARVQALLARESEGDIHMAIAAEKNIWNWDSIAFDGIKSFLRAI